MHPRTEELLRHLDDTHAALRATVASIPSSLRNTRPAPDRWSIAEVLEHLSRVESGLTRLLASKLADARQTGLLEPDPNASPIDDLVDRRLLDRTRRIVAGERVVPRGEMDADQAESALDSARQALRELLIAHDGMNLGLVRHPHPVLGEIDGYQWFAFIGTHEARHTHQIREIEETLARRE